MIRTKFPSKESIESTNYEYCHNKLNYYNQIFYDEYLKYRLIIFKNLYGEYNSESMSFPIEIKLIWQIVQT